MEIQKTCWRGKVALAPVIGWLGIALLLGMAGDSRADDDSGVSPLLTAQLQALQQEKASFTPAQQKMDSQLVFAAKAARGESIAGGAVPNLRVLAKPDTNGMIKVDIHATVTQGLVASLQALGAVVEGTFSQYGVIVARIPVKQAESFAGLADVQFVRPSVGFVTRNSDPEGVVAHRASQAISTFGVNGGGIKVGVMSDSVDFLSQVQALGDLGDVTVVPGQSGIPGTGEGTAMLEIVHAMAPGAQLFFATGGISEQSFAQNILTLRFTYGCDIIVDDIGYFDEPAFQDGILSQAVNAVAASGGLYFSSAGNAGNLDSRNSGTWEGDFRNGGAVSNLNVPKPGFFHNFGNTNFDMVVQPNAEGAPTVLLWSDPMGRSANDYDLYIVDAAGTNVLSASINTQNGSQDPLEEVAPPNAGEQVVIVLASGTNRFLHLDTIGGLLTNATAGNIRGHPGAAGAFGVAAVDVATAHSNPFTGGSANPVETFSSDGPRRVFFDANGTPITPGNFSSTGGMVLQKPDVAAADGVTTSVPGFAPFFGTSAAAPHAAAIAALLKSFNPTLTPTQVRQVFNNTALDIMGAGVDRDSGVGIIMAFQSLQSAPPPPPTPSLAIVGTTVSGGNGNGVLDINECDSFDVQIVNNGTATATDIRATLSTTTPGVAVTQSTATYPDIQPGAAVANATHFTVSVSTNVACGQTITLSLVLKYDQGSTTLPIELTAGCTDGGGRCPGIDLSIGMVAVPISVILHSNLTYQISVTNIGPDTATGVAVNDALPSSMTVSSAVSSQGSISISGQTVIASLGSIPLGGTATLTVTAVPNSVGSFLSTATVGSSEPDFNPANNTANLITTVTPPTADLGITLAANPDPVALGSILTYTINVTNSGPVGATNTIVTNTLAPGVTFASVEVSQGSAVVSGSNVICSLGTLGAGAPAVITIGVRAIAVGGITDRATVSSSVVDAVPANNSATITSTVVPASDITLAMSGNPLAAVLGSNVTYTYTVLNLGPSPAGTVTLADTLPTGATFVSGTPGYVPSGNSIIWTMTNLGVGASQTFTNVVGTASFTTNQVPLYMTNLAFISTSSSDPSPGNNSASIVTRVDLARPTIIPAGATLVNEGFLPPNGFVDPGEAITVSLRLQNIGNQSTANLVATLLATNGVTPTGNPSKSYGALAAGGDLATNQFSFIASTGGAGVTATLQLQDGTNNLGTIQFPFVFPAVSQFSNIADISIPDSGPGVPYPSTINVSGVSGLVGKVTVTLSNINHTFPDDVDILLVAPAGQSVLLMSHAGDGDAVSNVSLTFDDAAAGQLPPASQISSGTFRPSGFDPGSVVFPNAVAPLRNPPPPPYGNSLSLFNGTNANGPWSLYVLDSSPGDQGVILGGWSLAISAGTPVNQGGDVGISGIAAPSPVLTFSNLIYTFNITNNGPNVADAVAFTNVLSAGLSYVTANSTHGTPVFNNGIVTCLLGDMAVGSNVTITVITTPTIPGTITNRASAMAVDGDLNQANNTATIVTGVSAPVADLGISVSAFPSPAVVGNNLAITMVVSNNGPGTAIGVMVTNTMNGLATNANSPPFAVAGGVATASLGNMQPGAVATVTFNVTPPQLGQFPNTTSVGSLSSDPNPANNSQANVITVLTPFPNIVPAGAQLLAEAFNPPTGTINPGETVTLSLALTNSGSASTANLMATLLATNGVTSLSSPQAYGAVAPGGGTVSRAFVLRAGGANGGTLGVTLALTDGAQDLGTAVFNFMLPATNSFGNSTAIVIPDSGPATPYPATIVVSGLTGYTSKVTATISNLTHQFPNDVQALLVGPTGQKAVLMAGTGGPYSITNVTLTFDDTAPAYLPASSPVPSMIQPGTFKPTDDLALPRFPSPAPTGPYTNTLSAFNGTDANGTWSLYVLDTSPGDSGVIAGGWGLNITTIQLLGSTANLAAMGHLDGSFTITLSGVPEQVYIIDASTNLVDWIPVFTNTPASGTFQYTDPNISAYPRRFFRARLGP